MERFLYHKLVVSGGVCLLSIGLSAAPATRMEVRRPTTKTEVVYPSTKEAVTHPSSSVAVNHPTASAAVFQPTTAVSVTKPATTGAVSKPTTSVTVVKPTTTVIVTKPSTSVEVRQPGETDWKSASQGYGHTVASRSPEPLKTGSSASAATASMKSTYQPPQAKDFKTAKLGGGDEGLGNKINQAEKDAAAAALNIPKGEEVSLENVIKSSNTDVSNLQKKVEKKL